MVSMVFCDPPAVFGRRSAGRRRARGLCSQWFPGYPENPPAGSGERSAGVRQSASVQFSLRATPPRIAREDAQVDPGPLLRPNEVSPAVTLLHLLRLSAPPLLSQKVGAMRPSFDL